MTDENSRCAVEGAWGERTLPLAAVMEQSSEGMAVSDLRGRLKWLNYAFASMHGYEPDELIGKNLAIFHTPEQIPSVDRANKQIRETGSFTGEIWHIRRDGTVFPTLMQNSLYRDRTGNPIGMIATLRDISDLRQAENELRESRERFEAVAFSSADWIWEVDATGVYTFVSGNVKKILGYSSKELIGKTPFDMMHEDEAERVGKIFSGIAAEKKPIHDLENWNLSKDGSRVCLLTNGVPILGAHGELLGYRGVDKDITERKRMEQALLKSEEQYRTTFWHSVMGLYRTTPDGRILLANPALVKMLGYSSFDELSQRSLEDIGYEPPYARSTFKNQMDSQGQIIGMESAWTRSDGTVLYMRESAVAIRDESGTILYYEGNVEDITDRRHIELELEAAYNEMERRIAKRTRELAETNETLQMERKVLEAKNTALNEVLNHIEDSKQQLSGRIESNITKLAVPILHRLDRLVDPNARLLVALIRKTLQDITSPLLSSLERRSPELTPREVEVCVMIKGGLSSKEIASTLNISELTVLSKRKLIRKKLGISKKRVNLVTYLMSLERRDKKSRSAIP